MTKFKSIMLMIGDNFIPSIDGIIVSFEFDKYVLCFSSNFTVITSI